MSPSRGVLDLYSFSGERAELVDVSLELLVATLAILWTEPLSTKHLREESNKSTVAPGLAGPTAN